MKKDLRKTKKGAASFYIVAFSTLILVIIAASFATAVINEITRTSNDDLSQSAYDSALAGIEDAKLAFLNYKRCQEAGETGEKVPQGDGAINCKEINYWMNPKHADCYMVGHILGRIPKNVKYGEGESAEVLVSDTIKTNGNEITNNLKQAYTCAEIKLALNDYRATLASTNNSKVVKVDLANSIEAAMLTKVKIKWFSRSAQVDGFNFSNIMDVPAIARVNNFNWRVGFQPVANAKASVPPTISVEMVQTAKQFTLDDFTKVKMSGSDTGAGNQTDRATIVMVPTNDKEKARTDNYTSANVGDNMQWMGAYNGTENFLPSKWLAQSNLAASGRGGTNYPYVVYCNEDSTSEFACEATIDLPGPIGGGERNDDTLMFVVSLPYGQPDTEFALEFFCDESSTCSKQISGSTGNETDSSQAQLSGVQINIDSTGRANDLFRRVETRLEAADTGFVYPLYGIQLLGAKGSTLLKKNMEGVVTEYSQGTYDGYLDTIHGRLSN